MQRPPSRVDSKTRFALCNVPPFSLRSAGPPRLTPQPPEGVCYQALSWLPWFAFMARFVLGSKKANPNVDSSSVKVPPRGTRRPDAGVRPSASEEGARCTTHTPSLICEPKPRNKRGFVPYFKRSAKMGDSGRARARAAGGRANARMDARKTKASDNSTSPGALAKLMRSPRTASAINLFGFGINHLHCAPRAGALKR